MTSDEEFTLDDGTKFNRKVWVTNHPLEGVCHTCSISLQASLGWPRAMGTVERRAGVLGWVFWFEESVPDAVIQAYVDFYGCKEVRPCDHVAWERWEREKRIEAATVALEKAKREYDEATK